MTIVDSELSDTNQDRSARLVACNATQDQIAAALNDLNRRGEMPDWAVPYRISGSPGAFALGYTLLHHAAQASRSPAERDNLTDAYLERSALLGQAIAAPDWAARYVGVPMLASLVAGQWILHEAACRQQPTAHAALQSLVPHTWPAEPQRRFTLWRTVQREIAPLLHNRHAPALIKLGTAPPDRYQPCLHTLLRDVMHDVEHKVTSSELLPHLLRVLRINGTDENTRRRSLA